MNHSGFRLALAALVVLGLVVAGRFVQLQHRHQIEQRKSLSAIEQLAETLVISTLELRAAQQAYVASGQGEGYWSTRVSTGIQALGDGLLQLRQLTQDPAAQAAVDAASEQVPKFKEIDKRAIDYARGDQRLMASDLIFTDGLEATRTMIDQVHAATTREREVYAATRVAAQSSQLYAVVGVALLAIIVGFLLAPLPKRDEMTEAMSLAQRSRSQDVELLSGLAHASAGNPRPVVHSSDPDPQAPGVTDLQLAAAAELCTEFARVIDPGELPTLLQRSAKLLDAKGLIVWINDASGAALRPALAHGYSSQALAMMGTLPRDGDNATSAAYRDARIETVPGDSTRMAALVVPLMSATGCVGAVAVETAAGQETRPATQALATIVAAQLAALVAVPVPEPASARGSGGAARP